MMEISIIIPTRADKRCAPLLLRAIKSITTTQSTPAVPVVIANGSDCDPDLANVLRADATIRFYHCEEENVAQARHYGRLQVDTPYFGFLDDDDEYLPDSLPCRVAPLSRDPETDAAVTNGYRMVSDTREPCVTDLAAVASDPAGSLMRENWLASCGGLFRTDTVGAEFFPVDVSYFEWTYTALRLALSRRIAFVDEPTFVVHDTPASLSKSTAYLEGFPQAIHRMLELNMPPTIRRELHMKLSQAFHGLSCQRYHEGSLRTAWRCHLLSLIYPRGLIRYGLYTRQLIRASLRRCYRR